MIAVADVNAIWRLRPFEALSEFSPIVGLKPRRIFSQKSDIPHSRVVSTYSPYIEQDIVLPPGWASRWSIVTKHLISRTVRSRVKRAGERITGLVVTTPHYYRLTKHFSRTIPTFYYCSDDYGAYERWGNKVRQKEAETIRAVRHSFFVSECLARRAIKTYDIDPATVTVSPNATQKEFLEEPKDGRIESLIGRFPMLRRPLVGVVGMVNHRLDFELIADCADLSEVGTVVIIGAISDRLAGRDWDRARRHPKCFFLGARPHHELPDWMRAFDLALIPYKHTRLNRACSPMRLFDHLASGRPIVATDACQQVASFSEYVAVGPSSFAITESVKRVLRIPRDSEDDERQRSFARTQTWRDRAEAIWQIVEATSRA